MSQWCQLDSNSGPANDVALGSPVSMFQIVKNLEERGAIKLFAGTEGVFKTTEKGKSFIARIAPQLLDKSLPAVLEEKINNICIGHCSGDAINHLSNRIRTSFSSQVAFNEESESSFTGVNNNDDMKLPTDKRCLPGSGAVLNYPESILSITRRIHNGLVCAKGFCLKLNHS